MHVNPHSHSQAFLKSSAKQRDVQLSRSKQRWHPLWSASQEITMHWQKIFIHRPVNFLYCFWCGSTVCLRELKAAGGKRQTKDKKRESDGAALRWNEVLFFAAAALFRENPFINWCWSLLSPPFFFIKQWNNKTFSSCEGRRGWNPIVITPGRHGNSLLSAHTLHSVGPNYCRPHITFP